MAWSPARLLACIAMVAVVLVVPPDGVAGHTRGVRPGRASKQPFPANATRAEEIERQFMLWVRYMGSLEHSTFARAFPSYTLVVDKNPAFGDFTSIQAVVDSLPVINLVRVVIKGESYHIADARVHHPRGRRRRQDDRAMGRHDGHAGGPKGRPLGMLNSASFVVKAQYFLTRNITFKNTSPVQKPGAFGKQAVALRVSADNAAFVGCKFLGAQDTLYDHSGRLYYKDCYIEGSVDFIVSNRPSMLACPLTLLEFS